MINYCDIDNNYNLLLSKLGDTREMPQNSNIYV